ncbi:hypothetical protein J5N97_025161 [Dioscorea zingiberensis]|uniref:Mediator of RNA polymerase II transcription subunit 13 n=1 Tax=Dioscorea zingiberensis TaxID=325984 RepID=A0A9D5C875_9LILI|nr:hypothetical protein J5N97_025161 [Dioscorea zingiberensis]
MLVLLRASLKRVEATVNRVEVQGNLPSLRFVRLPGEQLRTVSWFQFLPSESDVNNLPDISLKVEQKDAATCLVLSGHLQLQNEGFLSAWTNSFVGPWDPSQGVHNPDEKIKLWLFIPGRHSSVSEKAQAAVSRLKAPGDSDEVAAALSQALKNSLERSLRLLSYMRFGDVFTRRALPTIEFVFAATEEAIYVHAVISKQKSANCSFIALFNLIFPFHFVKWFCINWSLGMSGGLCSDDMEKLLKYRSSNSVQEGIPGLLDVSPSDLVEASVCQIMATKFSRNTTIRVVVIMELFGFISSGILKPLVKLGTVVSGTTQDPYKSDYSVAEVGNPAAAGVQIGSNWGWDDDGINVDIQMLLSEFGDFGDFLKMMSLTLGRPLLRKACTFYGQDQARKL